MPLIGQKSKLLAIKKLALCHVRFLVKLYLIIFNYLQNKNTSFELEIKGVRISEKKSSDFLFYFKR